MRITMNNVETLTGVLEELMSAISNLEMPLEEWVELNEQTDSDSREARREVREEIEGFLPDLETALADACIALGVKV